MLIKLQSYPDLITCLSDIYEDEDKHLFEDVLRVSTSRKRESEAVVSLIFHVSAVVQSKGGEYLLIYGENLGVDHFDGEPELDATELDLAHRTEIMEKFPKWKILPGVIGE